jgi:glutamine synthetase
MCITSASPVQLALVISSLTFDVACSTPEELPIWNYDGSSTGQAPGHDSEVLLKPVALFPDPFRGLPHMLVLCETITPDHKPLPDNTRAPAKALFDRKLDEIPWFGAYAFTHACSLYS